MQGLKGFTMHISSTPSDSTAQAPAPAEDRAFDWQRDADDVVIRAQAAIACHLNPAGDVVIRQQADGYHYDEDPFVVVARNGLPRLIEHLQQLSELGRTDIETPPISAAGRRDTTGAERQRRYRERHRNGNGTVTRNADSVTASGKIIRAT